MANNEDQTKSTRALAARLVFAALKILKENGGEMRGKQVLEEVEKRVPLGEWEKARYEKTGYIRWRSVLHFFTIDLIKAGFLISDGKETQPTCMGIGVGGDLSVRMLL